MKIEYLWDRMLSADEAWVHVLEKNSEVHVEEISRKRGPSIKLVLYSEPEIFYEKNISEKLEDLIQKHEDYILAFKDLQSILKRNKKKPIPKLSKLPLVLDPGGRKMEMIKNLKPTKKAKNIYIYKANAYSNLQINIGLDLFIEEYGLENEKIDKNILKTIIKIENEIRSDKDNFLIRRKSGIGIKIRPDWISHQITTPHILCLQTDIKKFSILKPLSFKKDKYKIVYQTWNFEVVRKITD
jgi:hypothetical protein